MISALRKWLDSLKANGADLFRSPTALFYCVSTYRVKSQRGTEVLCERACKRTLLLIWPNHHSHVVRECAAAEKIKRFFVLRSRKMISLSRRLERAFILIEIFAHQPRTTDLTQNNIQEQWKSLDNGVFGLGNAA